MTADVVKASSRHHSQEGSIFCLNTASAFSIGDGEGEWEQGESVPPPPLPPQVKILGEKPNPTPTPSSFPSIPVHIANLT